jgi:hypothetical protein
MGTTDTRLLGTWQSDRRRTFRHFRPQPRCRPSSLRKLKSLFGKLIVRWADGTFECELDGILTAGVYRVVAKDATSVVVRCSDDSGTSLCHIHFDDCWYWLPVSGSMIEWFRRVEEAG